MARRIVVEHVDDIDGTSIDAGKGETIAFSVDGIDY
ncbi:Lsr2 dimerization domain-containing protein, partial [Rhodococcus koreensis]